MNGLIDYLINRDVEYKRNASLAKYSTVSLGENCDIMIFPNSTEKLAGLIRFLQGNDIGFRVLGNMSNVLPPSYVSKTVFVSTRKITRISIDGNFVFAECGALFSRLIAKAAKQGLSGYERLVGIPGTVGAMVLQNAGAYGASASDFLFDLRVLDLKSLNERVVSKGDASFYYRGSSLKSEGAILLEARFLLESSSKEEVFAQIEKIKKKRAASQPVAQKSLGSVFKRGSDFSPSYLIDKAGLKGMRVGGVRVSEKHAGFFVNDGGSVQDFKDLAEIVKREIYARFGKELELEVEYLD